MQGLLRQIADKLQFGAKKVEEGANEIREAADMAASAKLVSQYPMIHAQQLTTGPHRREQMLRQRPLPHRPSVSVHACRTGGYPSATSLPTAGIVSSVAW